MANQWLTNDDSPSAFAFSRSIAPSPKTLTPMPPLPGGEATPILEVIGVVGLVFFCLDGVLAFGFFAGVLSFTGVLGTGKVVLLC